MSILNFMGLYKTIFRSFNVSADTELIEQLEADGVKRIMIIKRSWIFGIFKSWIFTLMLIILLANIYLVFMNFSEESTAWALSSILVFSLLYWVFSVLIYFHKFKRIYGIRNTVVDISTIKEQLKVGDLAFSKFFNQTIFNYFILIGITIYIAYYIIFVSGFETGIYGGLNIFLLFFQIFLSTKFKKRMQDLEMDFSIILPGKIMFYNQSNLSRTEAVINSEKIKTISSSYSGIIGSMFNFGEITVMTEGNDANVGEVKLYFIAYPTETVYEINELLGKANKEA